MLTYEDIPTGVRCSAGLLVVWGFLLRKQSAASILLVGITTFAPRHHAPPDLKTALAEAFFILIMGIVGVLCFYAAGGLTTAQAWAANYSTILGAVLAIGGVWMTLNEYLHPPRDDFSSDSGLAYLFIIWPSVLAGLWWCVYLNLPHVRRHFRAPVQ